MKKNNIFLSIFFGIMALFLGVSFFAWSFAPYFQLVNYSSIFNQLASGDKVDITESGFYFSPFTYVQPELRSHFMYFLFDQYQNKETSLPASLLPVAVKALEDVTLRDSNYEKYFLALAEAYSLMNKLNPARDGHLLVLSEQNFQKALAIMPRNQRVIYGYALNLADQGKLGQGIALLEDSLKDAPNVLESHRRLASLLFRSGPKNYDKVLEHFEIGFSSAVDLETMRNIYTKLFSYYYQRKDVNRFLTVVKRLESLDTAQKELYLKIENYVNKNNMLPKIDIKFETN